MVVVAAAWLLQAAAVVGWLGCVSDHSGLQYRRTLNTKASKLVESSKYTEVYFCTQMWIHIRVTGYSGIYNGITGLSTKQL